MPSTHLPQSPASWPGLVTRRQVAEYLSCTPSTVIGYERSGRLPAAIPLSSKKFLYRKEQLLPALAEMLGEGAAP